MTGIKSEQSVLLVALASLSLLSTPGFATSKPITTTDLLRDLSPTEPWDKSVLSATKTVLFNQTASGDTDATVIEQAQLGFFTTTDCSGALIGGAFYTTPTGTPYSISVGTSFGLTAEGAWNAGRDKLSLSLVEMGTVQSIAMTFMSTTSTVPQSDFSNNSFACIQATCSAGPPGECTSSDGTKSFELKTTAAVGDPADGGVIADTGGLIAMATDASTNMKWTNVGSAVTGAQSDTDGSANTTAIIGDTSCSNSPGNCAADLCYTLFRGGYTAWVLPAKDQLHILFLSRVAIGNFSIDNYWSSTEDAGNPLNRAWFEGFNGGNQTSGVKTNLDSVRCVRAFTP